MLSNGSTARQQWIVWAIILLGSAWQLWLAIALPFHLDEFDFAVQAAQSIGSVPYRDFAPSKSILGSALATIPFRAGLSLEDGMLCFRLAMIACQAIWLVMFSRLLSREISGTAWCLTLVLLLGNPLYASESGVFRYDLLSGIIAACSLFLILRGKLLASGACAALCFLCQQKGVIVIAGSLGVLVALWWSDGWKTACKSTATWAFGLVLPLAIHYTLWSFLSDGMNPLARDVLTKASAVGTYLPYRHLWIDFYLRESPIFAVVSLATPLLCLLLPVVSRWQRPLGWAGLAILAAAIAYKAPHHNFYILLMPSLCLCMAIAMQACAQAMDNATRPRAGLRIAGWVMLIIATVWFSAPLARTATAPGRADQASILNIMRHVIPANGTYLSGARISVTHRHAPREISRNDDVCSAHLAGLPDAEALAIVTADPPDVVVITPYSRNLPAPIANWLGQEYAPISTSGLLLVRIRKPERGRLFIATPGRYEIRASSNQPGLVGERTVCNGDVIDIPAGNIHVSGIAACLPLPDQRTKDTLSHLPSCMPFRMAPPP
jgi:hypothetical protein